MTPTLYRRATKLRDGWKKRELSCERNAMQGKKEKKNACKVSVTAFPCLYHIFTRSVLFSSPELLYGVTQFLQLCSLRVHSSSGFLEKILHSSEVEISFAICYFFLSDVRTFAIVLFKPANDYNNSITQIIFLFFKFIYSCSIRMMSGCRNTLFENWKFSSAICLIFSTDSIKSLHSSQKSTVGV